MSRDPASVPRDDDGAAADRALVQLAVGVGRLVERVSLDLDVDGAGPRDVEHLQQFRPGAPVRRPDRCAERGGEEAGGQQPAADPDDLDHAVHRHRPPGELHGRRGTDEVKHRLRARPAGERPGGGGPPKNTTPAGPPAPPVSDRIEPAADESERSTWCAPTFDASASFSSLTSSATTVAPVIARRIWMPTCPRPPAPITTAVLPAGSASRLETIAWYGVSPASVSETVATGSRFPSGTRCRTSSTIRYSASAPGAPSPGGRIPSSAARGQ